MNALDLAIKNGVRVDGYVRVSLDPIGEPGLRRALGLLNLGAEGAVARQRPKLPQFGEIGDPGIVDRARDRFRERGICKPEPAPRRHSVGLVVEALRESLREVFDRRLAQELGMDRGHPIGAVGADNREVGHADVLGLALLDQAGSRHASRVGRVASANVVEQPPVDLEDDLELARNQKFHPVDRPALERLGKERVVGVGERRARDVPGFIPAEMRFVEQDAHEFRHGEARMGVVELDRGLLGQEAPIGIRTRETCGQHPRANRRRGNIPA